MHHPDYNTTYYTASILDGRVYFHLNRDLTLCFGETCGPNGLFTNYWNLIELLEEFFRGNTWTNCIKRRVEPEEVEISRGRLSQVPFTKIGKYPGHV